MKIRLLLVTSIIIPIKRLIIDEVLLKSIKVVAPFLITIIKIVIKNILITVILTFLLSISTYYLTPGMFKWILFKLGIDISDLSLFESVFEEENKIKNLQKQLSELLEEKNKLEIEFKKSEGEKIGIIESLRNMKIDKTQWWTVIFTISGVVMIYFLANGDDGSFFKPLVKTITSSSGKTIEFINENTVLLNNSLKTIYRQIENVDSRIDDIKNILDNINNKPQK
jgi:chaperonin cofactor prefoldin